MFLFFNAIVASLDGIVIGSIIRLQNRILTKKNILTIFITNLFLYFIFLKLYTYFNFTFMNKIVTSLLYLFFAINNLNEKEELKIKEKKLNIISCILIALTHSLDGISISLSFTNNYSLNLINIIFSTNSLILLLIGYYFATFFNKYKYSSYISAILFFLLFIFNFLF